jgi:NADH:ubiquinone oxidoreductase subunit D
MVIGSGALWDLRKLYPYEVYQQINFLIPQWSFVDCFDRYLIRMEELRASIGIIFFCLNNITPGEIKATDIKLLPPKNLMKSSM